MTATVSGIHLSGTHAARPAAGGPPAGSLYSCTTDSLIYRTDGTSWSTWASLAGTGLSNPMTTAGDIIVGGVSGAPARLAAGTAGYPLVGGGAGVASAYAAAGKFHGCHVYKNGTQTASPLLFDTEVVDTDAFHSTVSDTGRITIPSGLGGYYVFHFSSLGPASTDAKFRKNGTTVVGGRMYAQGEGYLHMTSPPTLLVATDYMEITNGGSSWGHATVFDAQSQFWCALLGT